MNSVKSIDIILENCEVYSFPATEIGEFNLSNIKKSICRIASNCIEECETVNTAVFEIFNNNRYRKDYFDENNTIDVFLRIFNCNDITQITVNYDNGESNTYYVAYKEEVPEQLGSANVNQKSYISELGNLYVVIDKDATIEDFFDIKEINDEETIKFYREMVS